jgi:hypothetical protein
MIPRPDSFLSRNLFLFCDLVKIIESSCAVSVSVAGRDIANFGDIVILDDGRNKLQVNMCGGNVFYYVAASG